MKGEIKNLDINTNRDLKATLKIFKNLYAKQSDDIEKELQKVYKSPSADKLSDRKSSVAKLDQKSQVSDKKSVKNKKTTKKNESLAKFF